MFRNYLEVVLYVINIVLMLYKISRMIKNYLKIRIRRFWNICQQLEVSRYKLHLEVSIYKLQMEVSRYKPHLEISFETVVVFRRRRVA